MINQKEFEEEIEKFINSIEDFRWEIEEYYEESLMT